MRYIGLLVLLFLSCSCSKENTENFLEFTPDGMVKITFDAYAIPTRTSLNDNTLQWTGTEEVNIWYQDGSGKIANTTATFEAFSGSNAKLSILIPSDAERNEFYAGVNVNCTGTYWNEKIFSVETKCQQTIYANNIDPDAVSVGARWRSNVSNDKPFLNFLNLHNSLKVTLDNQTGKIIEKITLSSSNSLACTNTWSISDEANLICEFVESRSSSIDLIGNIASGVATYYFSVPVKNNNGNKFRLDDMNLKFTFASSEQYEVNNETPLEIDKNSSCLIATLTLTTEKLFPSSAPLGTYWGTEFMKSWFSSGWTSNQKFTGIATYDTRDQVSAEAIASSSKSIEYNKSGNERMTGKFSFEFTVAESGKGTLSFWSQAGGAGHSASILKNGVEIKKITYQNTSEVYTSLDIDVIVGDVIRIKYNDTSSYAILYCGGDYASSKGTLDRRIRWDKFKDGSGIISSPEDLQSDNQSSFFNEL